MGINKATNDFLTGLLQLVSGSGLPACNVRLALDLVRGQVAELERQAIEQEKAKEKAVDTTAEKGA